MAYLKKIRKRPTLRKPDEGMNVQAPDFPQLGMRSSPAAGAEFSAACDRQSEDVIVHGLLAAFRTKAWVEARGWSVSLGTVGVE